LTLLLLYLVKVLIDWKKEKRQFVFSKESKKRISAIIKISVLAMVLLAWWFAFFAPWYNGGWVIAAFLPVGFVFLTKMITSFIAILIIISLLPKIKVHKISKVQAAKDAASPAL
jgi:hypothetical protein